MKVLVALDSFKGSIASFRGGSAVAEGIRRACPDATVTVSPLADGGEGTAEAIVTARGGAMRQIRVCGPLGASVTARYGILPQSGVAIMEMAEAAGLPLVPPERRDPLYTTTYGVGEMILDAAKQGCRDFIVGIGGSATNDGGIGMLNALGFAFTDDGGNAVAQGAVGLRTLSHISDRDVPPFIRECRFTIACDVKNPLCGAHGCSAIYAPQKGASAESIAHMDEWLARYAALTKSIYPDADPDIPGSGAAGGLGFAFLSYLGARLMPGIDIVIRETELEQRVADADIVVTGEGRLDGQSCMGKAPVGVALLAKKHGKPVIALAGCVRDDAVLCHAHGIDAFFPILPAPMSSDEAMREEIAYKNLAATAEQVFRLIGAVSQ